MKDLFLLSYLDKSKHLFGKIELTYEINH